jgi:hypothetical protein
MVNLAVVFLAVQAVSSNTVAVDFLRRSEAVPDGARFRPYVLELNVRGTSGKALLLSHSQTCSNAECEWFLYLPVDSGRHRFAGEIAFHPVGYRWDRQRSILTAYFRHGGGKGHFAEFRLTQSGFVETRGSSELVEDSAEFRERWSALEEGRSTGPPVWTCDWRRLLNGNDLWWEYRQETGGVPDDKRIRQTGIWARLQHALVKE